MGDWGNMAEFFSLLSFSSACAGNYIASQKSERQLSVWQVSGNGAATVFLE